jgi:hypothetical protein
VLFFFALIRLKFQWLLICGVALSLSSANIVGYYKCSNEQKAKVANLMQSGAVMGMTSIGMNLGGRMMGMFGDQAGQHQPVPQEPV